MLYIRRVVITETHKYEGSVHVRCSVTQNVAMSEPVEVNLTSKLVLSTICMFTSIGAPHLILHYVYLHNCWAYCNIISGVHYQEYATLLFL